ncbi:copper amine oxidase N-terminal domain-containing protein [Desulfallas sp. Bu1-1]|uniref:copper amine oxidase N-terminal domain-containing protein n=1 Tax=Desulfallas sp. Bu1-1 TaxID=2787620 RepID=UPI00189CA62B|nr:copper amine oxidase N-terminal domain-containing protein [Desulfallas sp. Bu1-1]MBF7081564.1 copper amine oxidase N-terminal domain-containing protein [Desulfallas sp. Bu1-1]
MLKKRKSISLAITLIFLFTVIMPVAGFAADNDNTKYSSTYNYVTADTEQAIGTAAVAAKSGMSVAGATYIQVKLTLPSGVEFTDKPTKDNVNNSSDPTKNFVNVTGLTGYIPDGSGTTYYVKSDSSSITLKGLIDTSTTATFETKFTFSYKDASGNTVKVMPVDIDSDFTGNLDATIEVWALSNNSVVWSESDTVTLAKVAGSGDVLVSAKTAKNVTKGSNKTGADIKVYETQPGKLASDEAVRFDIMTSGVKFSETNGSPDSNVQAVSFSGGTLYFTDDDYETLVFKPTAKSNIFPGDIVLTPILDVDPDATGDIKIRVSSVKGTVESSGYFKINTSTSTISRTTVVVATVGDAKAKIDKLEDNDTVAYSGQKTELDVSIKIKTEDGSSFKDGDMMTFKLNKGKFTKDPTVTGNGTSVKRYDSNKAFYVAFSGTSIADKFTLEDLEIKLPNDVEPGDITLTIGGDYGDLDDVTIGVVAKPITLSAEKTPILAEALNQKAGDIIIKEAGDGALKKDDVLVLELPSGVELNGKPKLDVVEGNFDGDITVIDDSIIALEVTRESSDASEIKIYNINYDTGRLALTGDVVLKAYYIDRDLVDGADSNTTVATLIEDYDDTGVIATVANATVVNENEVTATFKVGDEGVAVVNGRTLVQVNKLCEVLGMQKSWDEATKTAYFVLNGKVVAFPMGENAIYINGTKIAVDQGGKIINNYTYATLRGIQMAFGGELTWDDATKTATFKFVK